MAIKLPSTTITLQLIGISAQWWQVAVTYGTGSMIIRKTANRTTENCKAEVEFCKENSEQRKTRTPYFHKNKKTTCVELICQLHVPWYEEIPQYIRWSQGESIISLSKNDMGNAWNEWLGQKHRSFRMPRPNKFKFPTPISLTRDHSIKACILGRWGVLGKLKDFCVWGKWKTPACIHIALEHILEHSCGTGTFWTLSQNSRKPNIKGKPNFESVLHGGPPHLSAGPPPSSSPHLLSPRTPPPPWQPTPSPLNTHLRKILLCGGHQPPPSQTTHPGVLFLRLSNCL